MSLENENNLVAITLARTTSEKFIQSWFHPIWFVPIYAVKIEQDQNKLIMQKMKMGMIRAVGKFTDSVYEINLNDIVDFKKKFLFFSFLISFFAMIFNWQMPVYQLTLKDGTIYKICLFKAQKMGGGKQFSKEQRQKLLNILSERSNPT